MLHNEVPVPVGDFVAVFQPTFIWYSFVNVAARRKKNPLCSAALQLENSQWNINNAKAISLGFSLPVFT